MGFRGITSKMVKLFFVSSQNVDCVAIVTVQQHTNQSAVCQNLKGYEDQVSPRVSSIANRNSKQIT